MDKFVSYQPFKFIDVVLFAAGHKRVHPCSHLYCLMGSTKSLIYTLRSPEDLWP